MPSTTDPRQTYLQLAADGRILPRPGGERFWQLPEADMAQVGRDWLVSEYTFEADWPSWEMHPQADEFVYLLSGAVVLVLESPGGRQEIALKDRGAVVVPRGVWHTARVGTPSRMMHVTLGAGTQIRPA